MFVLFDSRAKGGTGSFDATVLSMDDDINELREEAKDYGGGAIYEFDYEDGELVNERFVEDVDG